MSYRFGDCMLDTDRRQLLRGGAPVDLTPKAYELLALLLDRYPKAVSKSEIHDHLWPGTFVSDVNLPALIFEIRKATGDEAGEPRYVRTVRGFGYGFCGEASRTSRPAGAGSGFVHMPYVWGRAFPLHPGENVIGRAPDADVFIDSSSASRRHAVVRVTGREAVLEDQGSKNGTQLKGRKIAGAVPLADGDEIAIGPLRIGYRLVKEEPTRTWKGE
jgi:DNA-binding winged helix-turn-helix (wHTH) protein